MRKAEKERKTKETENKAILNIDGEGKSDIKTGIGFLDHMLTLFSFHGLFDLDIYAKGDLEVDIHHTNEDVGIVLGQVFKEALGNKEGINRLGSASVPMEEVLANVTIDISGRGFFKFCGMQGKDAGSNIASVATEEDYDLNDATHFLDAFAKHLGMNLVVKLDQTSMDLHTTLEPVFKALGIALDQATQIDPRRKGIPSTKGIID